MNEYTRRNSLRLQGYDYSRPGYYFITICAKNGEQMFGKIVDGQMQLNEYGNTAEAELQTTARMWDFSLDCHVIMPNHVHFMAIVPERDSVGPPGYKKTPAKQFIPAMVQQYKAAVTRRLAFSLWHRSYYDEIVKTKQALDTIRRYIVQNPTSWEKDQLHPMNFDAYVSKHPL